MIFHVTRNPLIARLLLLYNNYRSSFNNRPVALNASRVLPGSIFFVDAYVPLILLLLSFPRRQITFSLWIFLPFWCYKYHTHRFLLSGWAEKGYLTSLPLHSQGCVTGGFIMSCYLHV